MKRCLACLLYCILLLAVPAVEAQQPDRYHLDLYNGLPSNLIYGIFIDNFGYLWVCTDKGIARYNGYGIKKYSTEEGLPSNDTWGLHSDRKNRLWLMGLSNRIGYISNGIYKDAYVVNNRGGFYILFISNYKDGIRFFNDRDIGNSKRILYTERNDTIRATATYDFYCSFFSNDELFCRKGDTTLYKRMNDDGSAVVTDVYVYKPGFKQFQTGYVVFAKKELNFLRYTNHVSVFDIKTRTASQIDLYDASGRPDPVSVIFNNGSIELTIVTQQYIYHMDSNLRITHRYPVHELIDDTSRTNGLRISGFFKDPFWKKCVATQNNGVFINYTDGNYFNKVLPADLADYQWIGNTPNDSLSYWWSYKARTLLRCGESGAIVHEQYKNVYDAVRLVPYKSDTSLLIEKGNIFYYIPSRKTVSKATLWYRYVRNGKLTNWTMHAPYIRDFAPTVPGQFYTAGNGFLECVMSGDSVTATIRDESRYNYTLYDVTRNIYWAYYNDRVLLYDPCSHTRVIADPVLQSLGISSVEHLYIDSLSGHIFVKDHNRLLVIDPVKGSMTALFNNYNLKEARFALKNGLIVVAGKFGVLFCDVKNLHDKKKQLVFPNIKNSHYFQVLDMAVMKNNLLLKTDRCAYLLPLPGDSSFVRPQPPAARKIIAGYRDTLHSLPATAQLNITTTSDKLLFDVINPEGNGTVRYKYRITELGNKWHELNDNELKLPLLTPGSYYHLHLTVSDEVWISDDVPLTLYMVPEWWQTPGWSAAISTFLVLLVALILLLVILLTKYFVTRAARRRQFLNTLELRAIHAQINPHFIFNTLNTALYFIKKEKTDEAADHVSRFSRLLRTYLESAHKRYTSIADEITSIKNYIGLQQTRFDDMFTYEIIVKDDLNTDIIYIPSLLLQPLIENAINHGLTPRGRGGHLEVIFCRDKSGAGIVCVIDDNGIGRRQSAINKKDSETKRTSHGSRLTEELVDVFNRYEKMGIYIQYLDKEPPETGTTVTITIKQPRYER